MNKNVMSMICTVIKGVSLSVLRYGLWSDNFLYVTDLEHYLRIDVKTRTGKDEMVNLDLLTKTNNIRASVCGSVSTCDMPDVLGVFDRSLQNSNTGKVDGVFKHTKEIQKFVSHEKSRTVLQNIHICKDGFIEATDGSRMLRILSPLRGYDMMIDNKSCSILSLFGSQNIYFNNGYYFFDGIDIRYALKKIEGVYPDTVKVVRNPKKSSSVVTPIEVKFIRKYVSDVLPFANPVTRMVTIDMDGTISAQSEDTGSMSIVCNCIPKPLSKIGFNGNYLLMILDNIGISPISFEYGDKSTDPLIMRNDERLLLIAPLRLS
jgi:hypothetical protein